MGQQLIKELGENVKTTNTIFKTAASGPERQEAAKNAQESAQNLIDALNDIKTFGTDVIRGYNSKQIQIAAITLAELLTRLNTIKIEIKSKRMEIADMTNVGVFIDTALSGKEALRNQAIKEQKKSSRNKKSHKKSN